MTTKKKNSPSKAPANHQIRLEYVPLDTLKLWDKNPKKHDLGQITDSIYRYGFQDPAKFDATLGGLIFGNGRTEALIKAQAAGREPPRGIMLDDKGRWCAPVLFGNDLESGNAASAFAIDHNNLTMAGSHTPEDMARMWSAEGYQSLMQSLKSANDLPITAWMPPDEKPAPEAQMDKADELLKKWKVKTGDLWQIGENRLLCGDCTKAEDVERVMGKEKADMVFEDPPYNVASKGRNYAADAPTQKKTYEALKSAEWDKDFDILPHLKVLKEILADDCAVYICTSHWLVQTIWEWMWEWSKYCSYCVWVKPNPAPSLAKRHYTWATELIPYAVRGKHVCNFPLSGHALNWWEIVSGTHSEDHPTQKPIEVPERAIEFSSSKKAVIFDGFLGSGTTLVACERLGRKGRAIEIAPKYVAVALERLSQMGLEPKLIK